MRVVYDVTAGEVRDGCGQPDTSDEILEALDRA